MMRKRKRRPACIHGNLCREIWIKTGYIYSVKCPFECKFYKSAEEGEK